MIIYSCLLISQDASAAEDTSKVNLEKDVILPGINDIMPKRKWRKITRRDQSIIFSHFFLLDVSLHQMLQKYNDYGDYAINREHEYFII